MMPSATDRIRVEIYPDANPTLFAQVYGGLGELARSGEIDLVFRRSPATVLADPATGIPTERRDTLWLDVFRGDETPVSVCIDLHDESDIVAVERLRLCHAYVKRSLSPLTLESLGPAERRKVVPYGLHYVCGSRHGGSPWHQWKAYSDYAAPREKRRWRTNAVLASCPSFVGDAMKGLPSNYRRYEVPPSVPTQPVIFYQTRVWHEMLESNLPLHEFRAELIRGLRRTFGERFRGGFIPTNIAAERFPDCLSPLPFRRRDFLRLVRESLVTVTPVGLFQCLSWKLPEYLAASRCVVSEAFDVEIPEPLREERNLLSFRTVDECIAACDRLLSDASLAADMRNMNWDYYRTQVRPWELMRSVLARSLTVAAP